MTKKMHVVFLLDETGSMMVNKNQTILGFNEYVDGLRGSKNADRARFSRIRFNSNRIINDFRGVRLSEVPTLGQDTYNPQALTPLYDAIAQGINLVQELVGGKDTVLFVIQTDGEENSSTHYTREQIFRLIDEKKALGWTFVFLGADQDAYLASSSIGIPRMNTMSYAGEKTQVTFRNAGLVGASYLDSGGQQTSEFFGEDSDH